MDRNNLKRLMLVSMTVALTACASSSPRNDEVKEGEAAAKGSTVASTSRELAAEVKQVSVPADEKQSTTPIAEKQPAATPSAASESNALAVDTEKRTDATNSLETPSPEKTAAVENKAAPVAVNKPAQPAKLMVPSDPNTFLVTADVKDQSHPFYGVGDKRGFLVNGQMGKALVLTRGESYQFDVDTGVQHDFYFSTSDRGWGAGVITEGIDGQFTYDGTVTVKPGSATPDAMYYQCRNHKNMGGRIHVINKGDKADFDDVKVAASGSAEKVVQVTEQQVKQKLAYANMLMKSDSAKRILESDNAEAKALKKQALESLALADSALASKKNNEAMDAVDEALRAINSANLLAPSSTAASESQHKTEYEHLIKEIEGYKKSYKKNRDKQGANAKVKLDEQKFDGLLAQAKKSADASNYAEALKPAKEASKMITDVVSVMLNDSVVVYDKDFATPKEEYEYELSRYESYLELIPIAKEQKQPNPGQIQLMDQFVEKAEKIASEGADIAKKGDYPLAIQAYQAATDNLNRALMLIGVR